ncbi:hypothetical protein FM106_30060 [Brachybacterium faecium]|jgi:hypothetical protein|nr:hypothetical protein FM106_30060 [Brachybacterium faecium]HJG52179.1 hypothetical protein [Brachybacterium faecium]
MTSIMRRTVRGTAATLGALAIVAGAAACGGLTGGDEETDDSTTVEEGSSEDGPDSEDDASEADGTAAEEGEGAAEEGAEAAEEAESAAEEEAEDASDADGDTSAEEGEDAEAGSLSEDDLTAVGDRFYEFLEAAAQADGDAACALVMNPATDAPLGDAERGACAQGFEERAEEQGVDPAIFDVIDRSMIEGVDNGDGTAGITMLGKDGGFTFVEADDGQWYIDGNDFL